MKRWLKAVATILTATFTFAGVASAEEIYITPKMLCLRFRALLLKGCF